MKNVIRDILEAEAKARSEVSAARDEAVDTIAMARSAAARIVARNEARTQRAMDRYVSARRKRLVARVDELDNAAERDRQALQAGLETELPALVQRWVSRFWPGPTDDRS